MEMIKMRLSMLFRTYAIRFELSHNRKKLLEKNSPKIEIFAKCCTLMAIFHDEGVKMEKCHGNDKDAPFHALS